MYLKYLKEHVIDKMVSDNKMPDFLALTYLQMCSLLQYIGPSTPGIVTVLLITGLPASQHFAWKTVVLQKCWLSE